MIISEDQSSIPWWQVLVKAVKHVINVLPSTLTKQTPIIKNWSPGKIRILSKETNVKLFDGVNKETRKKRIDAFSEDQKRKWLTFTNKIR